MSLTKQLRKKTLEENKFLKIHAEIEDVLAKVSDTATIEYYIKEVDVSKAKVEDAYEAIFVDCAEEELDDYLNKYEVFKKKFNALSIELSRTLAKLKLNEVANVNSSETKVNREVKLPKLELPIFSGAIEQWLSFSDLFTATVHENSELSEAQKLQYLKSVLRGEPAKIVQSLPILNCNYSIAWELLRERYSNKRELVYAHIKKLLNQPTLHSESAAALLSLVDTTNECIRSLEILEQKVSDFSEILIVYVLLQKLDPNTKLWWERHLKGEQLPTLKELINFIKDYARSIQSLKPNFNQNKLSKAKLNSMTVSVNNNELCKMCQGNHKIFKCDEFNKLGVEDKIKIVKQKKLCFNCLGNFHRSDQCKSSKSCNKCNKKHNTLIHIERVVNNSSESNQERRRSFSPTRGITSGERQAPPRTPLPPAAVSAPNINTSELVTCIGDLKRCNYGMLATVMVKVRDQHGQFQFMRCLIDAGSNVNFMTERAIQRLGLKRKNANFEIRSLGSNPSGFTQGLVDVVFTPHFENSKKFTASCFVLKKITSDQPHVKYNPDTLKHLSNITLADPKWYEPGPIDMLLGVSISLTIMRGEKIFGQPGMPFGINSELGWLIAGNSETFSDQSARITINHATVQPDLITKFFELENVPTTELFTREEKQCEDYFQKTHFRNKDGRYVVRLPFKNNNVELGESKSVAERRFLNLEKKLTSEPKIYESYKSFMREYLDLGHMQEIPTNEIDKPVSKIFYLPHHHVIRESSATTKLRVVFDASAKSSNGISLNDKLLIGPRVQEELFYILLRFRKYNIAISADITKMYRQVQMFPEDSNYQRIVWREHPSNELTEYILTTVTYGTSSAPYLATRVLRQLALDEASNYPLASAVALKDFYMDDLLSGTSSSEEAVELISQLQDMLNAGGFELQKWTSNDPSVLKNVSPELKATKHIDKEMNPEQENCSKLLGIIWNQDKDHFSVSVSELPITTETTKRSILSDISKIFDPMGWIAPVVVSAKILLQRLWTLDLSWDEPIPEEHIRKWREFRRQLPKLKEITIPRAVLISSPAYIEIHAFCDTSEKAYGTAIYLKSVSSELKVVVNLLTAKTRVAPIKQITIPRLELCAALLQANLLKVVVEALNLPINKIYAWTDSTVVLSWLSSEPRRWQTFVGNRVSAIQQIIPIESWQHIEGKQNPADFASRGLLPTDLNSCELWWHGPPWLKEVNLELSLSREIFNEESLHEERKKPFCGVSEIKEELAIIFKVSSLIKLQCIIAWCLRFIANSRLPNLLRKYNYLTSSELSHALKCIIKQVQHSAFNSEIQSLQTNRGMPKGSKIINLAPYLDNEGILRVGGRLRNANLAVDQINPILIPKNHHLTELIIKHYHLIHLHAGPQLLLSVIRQRFWIPCGRDVVRRFVKKCVTRFRLSSTVANQIMADLPASRVNPSRPFSKTGVDYAGPFSYKTRSGRGIKTLKCYIAIFVCFATRAIHLELVSDLSTQAFLASLRRFVARRGKPSEIISDCATKFIGASKELKSMYKLVKDSQKNIEVTKYLATEGIAWSFNPPAAPHFGGLWEAGVKSMKYHLRRTMGKSVLTFEEFGTLLTQVEACLNSRPLCPVSSDPNDFSALTPGHFLIGTALTAIPENDLTEMPISPLRRWQLVQRLFQQFWKR